MADSEAGPSKRKSVFKNPRNLKRLTHAEIETFVNAISDMEDEFTEEFTDDVDDDSSYGEEQSDSSSVGSLDGDEDVDTKAGILMVDDGGMNIDNDDNMRWVDNGVLRNIPFTKKKRLIFEPVNDTIPIDYFFLIANHEFFNLLLEEMNRYGQEMFKVNDWKLITQPEIRTFIGLLFHMGTIQLSQINDYWTSDPLFNIKCFSESMVRDRFRIILKCLDFANNAEDINQDKLYKNNPLTNFFNKRMCEIYQPGKPLLLDESMILWNGRFISKQYSKHHKHGTKFYMLTEPNGLILKVCTYAGTRDTVRETSHVSEIVYHMMDGNLNFGHSLYMDDLYNSFHLAKELLEVKTYCTGTLQTKREGNPSEVLKTKLRRRETIGKYKDGVLIGKWKDNDEVLYISTEFKNNIMGYVNKFNRVVTQPQPLIRYNEYMSGIDKRDQILACYPDVKKGLRWCKKIGIHFLQLMLLNASILYDQYSPIKMNFHEFRLAVTRFLLNIETERNYMSTELTPIRYGHVLTKIEEKNAKGATRRKRCRVCSEKKIRKNTVFHCKGCADFPGLCVGDCFVQFHK